jgi:hypothetical protein
MTPKFIFAGDRSHIASAQAATMRTYNALFVSHRFPFGFAARFVRKYCAEI